MDADDEAPSLTIFEEREEHMVSPNAPTPTLKLGQFLIPTITTLSQAPAPPLPTHPPSSPEPVEFYFKGWRYPPKKWVDWVDKLVPIYGPLWKHLGIHESILGSKYKICKDQDLILALIEFWSFETNTFVFAWGEASITLEDISVIGGYPVLGQTLSTDFRLSNEMLAIHENLLKQHAGFSKSTAKKASYSEWINCYMENSTEMGHVAFLALWLSRYVFPYPPGEIVGKHVFSVAVHLAYGTKIALAPVVLASLLKDLRFLKGRSSTNPKSIMVWGPLQLLKIWAVEHFPSLSSNCNNRVSLNEPRVARWHNLKLHSQLEDVKSIINSFGNFYWQPYTATMIDWCSPKDREDVVFNVGHEEVLQSFARCLRPCYIAAFDGVVEQYLPHRVSRQFGFDQDIPDKYEQCDLGVDSVWRYYDKTIGNVNLLVRSRFRELSVTKRYQAWWTNSIARPNGVKDIMVQQDNPKRHEEVEPRAMDLSAPPGFLHKRGIQEAVQGQISSLMIVHPSKTNIDSGTLVKKTTSGKDEKTKNGSLECIVIDDDEIKTMTYEERKKKIASDSVCIIFDSDEETDTDDAGPELEKKASKREELNANLKRKFDSVAEQTGEVGPSRP